MIWNCIAAAAFVLVDEPLFRREHTMKNVTNLTAMSAGLMIASTVAFGQPTSSGRAEIMTSVPNNSATVTDWYKQTVYDPSDNKIGEIMDVLVSPEGRATALIVGVGGFLGAGEKDVAVPFSAVKHTLKDKKIYLTMDTTKDALKAAPGFKYDRERTSWVPDAPAK
jgi:sporulation protein YlmC with PRC-barrel domain